MAWQTINFYITLHMIAVARCSHDERTRAYVRKRSPDGKANLDILRRLKRYIAREVYKILRATHSSNPTLYPKPLNRHRSFYVRVAVWQAIDNAHDIWTNPVLEIDAASDRASGCSIGSTRYDRRLARPADAAQCALKSRLEAKGMQSDEMSYSSGF